jgi:glycosyltransferase involved in cell wall biosynthesis
MQNTAIADMLAQRVPMTAGTIFHPAGDNASWWPEYRAMNPRARLVDKDAGHDSVDCIVYDGVPEHSGDLLAAIRQHLDLLAPDGVIIIHMANSDYWRNTEALLLGTGPIPGQTPAGLSPRQIQLELERLGLTIHDITAAPDEPEAASRFAEAIAPSLRALGADPAEYAVRSASKSVIVRAGKTPRQRLSVSGTMLSPVGGVSDVRVVLPLRALATEPAIVTRIATAPEDSNPHDGVARIFVLHRPAMIGAAGLDALNSMAKSGHVIVTEFDDLPDIFEMMRHGGALGFYGAHAIQTSTVKLAERLREYCPEIAVFPNAVTSLPDVVNFRDPNRLTFFFGALNRERDWRDLMPVLNEIAGIAGDRLRFEVVHDSQFFQALETPHKRFTPTCDYETYQALLVQSEISFMPLLDTPFSRAKSDLKFVEAASCRTVALASHVVYGNSIDDGRTGFLFRDPVELRSRLLRLIALPTIARGIAGAARQYVIDERMLAYQVAPRAAWYRSLWARREELEEARRERIGRMGATIA